MGLYLINSRQWGMPRKDIAVMHFTLGPIKPWHWFAPWICDEFAVWQNLRARLALQDAAQVPPCRVPRVAVQPADKRVQQF